MAGEFVLVRLEKIAGADLNVFDFDYDLTWMAFFISADEKVYGRYGGRDAASAEKRLSLEGLKFAMSQALAAQRRAAKDKPVHPAAAPLLAEQYPAAQRRKGGECIHCHQVYEFRREQRKTTGQWQRDEVWVYPLPENVGLTLDLDQGNRVRAVAADSPAAGAGLRAGDAIQTVNEISTASSADVQYGLQRAPARGQVSVSWSRDGKDMSGQLKLAEGWRKTNITWRPSMLDILPSLSVHGRDLSAQEKKALGLPEKKLAFQQIKPLLAEARAAGVRENDVIIGIDRQFPEMTSIQLNAFVRQNYLVGERCTLHILRNGKRLDLPLTLK